MKYLLEATGNQKNKDDYDDILIPVEIYQDGERDNTSIIIDLGNGKNWWIPITELDHLLYIINGLTKEES